MAMGMASGGGRRRRGRRRGGPMSEINVTPLVDVMLVLLIIFMVTAPLLTSGVPIDLPDSRANALPQDAEQVTISIDGSGAVFIDDAPVPAGGLPAALGEVSKDTNVTLRADKSLDYGLVMGVMGELNRAGLNRIALVGNGGGGAAVNDRSSGAP